MAIDDPPTRRFGRCLEAANVHHNPTPGPAVSPWLYGHNWVCLPMLVGHPLYGHHRISLAKRAGQSEASRHISYVSRGVKVEGRCKSFLATSPLVQGPIRVVLLEHSNGNWAAHLSTDPSMPPEAILAAISDRSAIEEHFRDVKEIWGAGQQQVRNL